MIFNPNAFGATEVETAYLQKSLGDPQVASQLGSNSQHHAKTYISQLSWELCDANSSMIYPVQAWHLWFSSSFGQHFKSHGAIQIIT
jgi:hypothetical protein